ncbi:hypothetical protein [Chryseobacterium nepalense]|uniref:GapS4b family protein n=1 Tax=Chryseobacterium nepalense TaxID=1854498 RepID=UPI002DFCD6AE|nr:hypothetical protein [Chryseobacterium nepalense]
MKKEILPQGDLIRQLLVKSNITSSNINQLLREKGVFLGHNEKNNSVPLLMKSIISPKDYEGLYNTQKNKEETIKYKTSSIRCNTDFELSDLFDNHIDLNKSINERHTYKPNYKVIGNPNFYFEDSNTIILEYNIERQNLLNDWTSNLTYHKGAVTLKKLSDGDLQISIQQNSTSKETLEVNNIIVGKLKEVLKDKSIIRSNEDIISIKFKDFDNTSRIHFFYAFVSNFSIYLEFKSITDVDLYLDGNVESHEDVKRFLDEIDNLKLNGKELQNHILLTKIEYFQKLIFGSIKFRYKLNYQGIDGITIISLNFPEYVKNKEESSELQVSIDFILNKKYRNSQTENEIRKKLLEAVEIKKIEAYNNFKL